ncbi:MAG: alkaline phosphatase family protein, partial [Flavobacteriales bacterium]|nr:alkaline phosphatase family protein [Flavobacteriales bacterium]
TGWSTMLTGVWEQKHKAVDNSFTNNQFANWPHFFARLKSVDPTLSLHSISHWAPINTVITSQADQELNVPTDQAVADAAVNLLQSGDPDVLFLQFDDVDHAGHLNGFGTTVAPYLAAIEVVDQQLGPVLNALKQRPSNEKWMVMVTTDHGGNLSGHGGITFEEQRTFTFASGPGIDPNLRPADRDTSVAPTSIAFAAGRHVRVANVSPYQFGSAQDFTVECRVKMPTSWAGDPVIVGNKNWNSGVNPGFVLSTNTSGGTWKFNIGDGVDRVDLTGLPITDGQWHHLAVTCDRNGEARIFQDGLLLRTASMAAIGDITNALQLCFGQDGTTTYGTALTGTVAEVRIWNSELPIETVSAWSGKTISLSHPNSANLIGHWAMNEGVGGSLTNGVAGAPNAQHYVSGSPANATWSANALPLITTDLSGTPAQADLVPTVLSYLCIANDPTWQLDGRSLIPVCARVEVDASFFLGGPYDTNTGLMTDGIRAANLLPTTEPYTGLGYDHAMLGGGESVGGGVFAQLGANAVVDWVVLEQRSGTDPTRILASKSCLLQRDGDVVDVDGVSLPRMPLILGSHHLAVHHRNHLGAMSAQPLNFSLAATTSASFTDPAFPLFGTEAMRTQGAVRTAWPGDATRDGDAKYTGAGNDRDPILSFIGGLIPTLSVPGYQLQDISLDGVVKYTGTGNDRDLILLTIGGAVPTAVRAAQLP